MGDEKDYDERTPYQLPFPKEAQEEIVIPDAIPVDERLWVPQAENVWFRPLCLNRSQGYWMNILRVRKSGVLSFVVDGAHPGDIGTLLDQQDIAVRVGHHCAMPLMHHLELPGTVRASFSLYNNTDDLDRFVAALTKALSFL